MADLLDQIRTDMHVRLSELRPLVDEHARLQTALRALGGVDGEAFGPETTGGGAAPVSRPRTRRTEPAKPRERSPRGANRQAVLQAVRERPGASSAEIAAVSGVEQNTLYGVLRRLVKDGEVQRRELPTGRTGYAPGSAQPAEPIRPVKSAGQQTAQVERDEDPNR